MDKRNILISAKTIEEFGEISSYLDLLNNNFIEKFNEVRSGVSSDILFFTNDNATGKDMLVIPELAENISLNLENNLESLVINSKMYGASCVFSIKINGKKMTISTSVKSFSEIKNFSSMNIIIVKLQIIFFIVGPVLIGMEGIMSYSHITYTLY